MEKIFDNFEWKNGSDGGTPLSAANLNKINNAVDDIDNNLIALNTDVNNNIEELKNDILGIEKINLFSYDTREADSYLDKNNGKVITLSGYYVSNFIPVEPNTRYYLQGGYSKYSAICGYFGANEDDFTETITLVDVDYEYSGYFITGDTTNYIRFQVKNRDTWLNTGFNEAETEEKPISTRVRINGNNIEPLTIDAKHIRGLPVVNLFDRYSDADDIGFYLRNNFGTLVQNTDYNVTYYIPVEENTIYHVKGFYTGNGMYGFYDKNRTFIDVGEVIERTSNYKMQVRTPSGARYARFTYLSNSSLKLIVSKNDIDDGDHELDFSDLVPRINKRLTAIEKIQNPWFGKKVLVLGDSISNRDYHYSGNEVWDKWPTILANKKNFTLVNDSVIAAGFAANSSDTSNNNLVDRIQLHTSEEEYDLILIFMGINDAIKQIPVGSSSTISADSPKTDFYSAVDYCLNYIFSVFASAKVGVLLPLPTSGEHVAGSSSSIYVEALKERCIYYNIPYCDLRNQGGFRPYIKEFRNMFTEEGGDGNPDGLHPNKDWDNNYLAPLIGNFIDRFVI